MYRHVATFGEVACTHASFRESESGLGELRTQIYRLAVLSAIISSIPSMAEAGSAGNCSMSMPPSRKGWMRLPKSMGQDQAAAHADLRAGCGRVLEIDRHDILWTPAQKAARSPTFLRENVVPYARRYSPSPTRSRPERSYLQQRQDLIMNADG